jgi:hypothetical protein
MRMWFVGGLFVALLLVLPGAEAGKKAKKDEDPKEALQPLQEFIGGWKGSGSSEKNKSEIWKETASWSWRFKGKDVFMSVDMDTGRLFKGGELRFLPDKSKYQLVLTDKNGTKQAYEGEIKKDVLTLERVDEDTGDTHQLKINTAADGDRLIYTFLVRPEGRTMFQKQLQIGYTKEGVTFGVETGGKKPECVVTGGLGTSAVSYMGATYYVCCSGCRDAFNDNPAKIIAEYKAKKKKGG